MTGFKVCALMPLVLLAGCAVGPDYRRPDIPAGASFTEAALGAPMVESDDVPAAWWRAFGSPALDSLVAQAFRDNPDLAAATAAVRAADENRRAQMGSFFPAVEADAGITRNRDAVATLSPATAAGAPVYSLTTGRLNLSYVFDVFGGARRQYEAAAAQADLQRYQREAAKLTLAANVVLGVVQEASLREQIAATRAMIDDETQVLDLLRREAALGQIAEADAIAEEAALAQVRATLPPLEQKLAQQRTALAVLIGQAPSREPEPRFTLADLHLPATLPLSLPAQLVDQRPDVRAAEAVLHGATAGVGVATAAMLPAITLSAGAGSSAADAGVLFGPGTVFWNLGAGLMQPVFQGGALLHRKRAAAAAADQARAQYRGVVLGAFQNVLDTLHAIDFDSRTLQEAEAAADAAARSLSITRRELELGQISGLALLNTERTYQQATLALIQARAARYGDAVALFQALGGGWWNQPSRSAL